MAQARVVALSLGASGKPEPTDRELVLGALRNETRAKDALIRRHLRMARGLAYQLVTNEADLEDLVHDAFIDALSNLDSLRDPDAFAGWLRSVVVRQARRCLRRRRLLRRLGLLHTSDLAEAQNFAASVPPDTATELSRVYRALSRLGADCQVVFVLSRLQGWNLAQVAAETGLSLSTVKRRMKRAEVELAVELSRERAGYG